MSATTRRARTAALVPQLDAAFLATLAEAARVVGWDGEFTEIVSFVREVYRLAGQSAPELDAYPYDSE